MRRASVLLEIGTADLFPRTPLSPGDVSFHRLGGPASFVGLAPRSVGLHFRQR